MSTPLDTFFTAYVTAMLWATNDESDESGGIPMDYNYDISDISPESLFEMRGDCDGFLRSAIGGHVVKDLLAALPQSEGIFSQAGHDFWLTRAGHGTGFWDRPGVYGEQLAKDLTNLCKTFPEQWPYVGDDNQIWL